MKILNNNLPKAAYQILGRVKGTETGKLSNAYSVSKNIMKKQARKMHADAILDLHYSQTPTNQNQMATVIMTGIAIKITNQKYINKLFKGVC